VRNCCRAPHVLDPDVLHTVDVGSEVVVADDGQGFPATTTPGDGVGLGSMRERAEELGGRLVLGHGVAGGALVTAVLPLGSTT